jgi:hypothetical protein
MEQTPMPRIPTTKTRTVHSARAENTNAARTRRAARREFLNRIAGITGALAAPWVIPASARGAEGSPAPSERITVGLIGNGLMGSGHLGRLLRDKSVRVLAVCDVDRVRRETGKQRVDETYAAERPSGTYSGCSACNDYRELLVRPDTDAVVIATPDHWHALQSVDAAKAGKDIYCEKPISLTVREGRQLVDAVRRYDRVFQTGTQYRSIPTIRRVCQFVREGGLGKIKSVFTLWTSLAGFLRNPRFRQYAQAINIERSGSVYIPLDFPLPAAPTPKGLDWDLWVGPAPRRPYNPLYHVNPSPGVVPWSFCEDFGAASVTWHQSHSADVIQYALGVEENGPVELIHPRDGTHPTLTCRYADGTLLHFVDHWGMVKDVYKAVPASARLAGNFGGVFVGQRGWITSMATGGPIDGGPEEVLKEMKLKRREVNIGANDHHANWFECIRTRGRPSSHEEIGHRSASLGHLTIIAHKLERSLKWDPAREQTPDDDAANRLCARALREPWRM